MGVSLPERQCTSPECSWSTYAKRVRRVEEEGRKGMTLWEHWK